MKKYVILFILIIILHIQHLSSFNIIIEDINEKYGLAKNRVNCVFQDSIGFLWFGKANGLYKFDLNGFTKYNQQGNNFDGFPESNVTAIIEIEPGLLLVGTQDKGLFIFNTIIERYDSIICKSTFDFTNLLISDMHKEQNGTIWIGTISGLIQIRKSENQENKFEIIEVFNRKNSSLTSSGIIDIIESHDGNIWFLTMFDIGFYNSSTKSIETFQAVGANSSVAFLDTNNILKGCFESGLKIFNTKSFQTKDLIIKGLEGYTQVRHVFKDSNSNIWISISNVGLILWNNAFQKSEPRLISNNNEKYRGLTSNVIYNIYESRDGAIWLCTEEGISMINMKPEFFHSCSFGFKYDHGFAIGIRALVDSKNGFIWTGTIGDGLKIFNIYDGNVTDVNLKYQGNQIGKNIQAILNDYHGNIWLGTEGEGVIKFIPDVNTGYTSGRIINYRFNPNSFLTTPLLSNYIMCFLEDRHKNIWIGTWLGLSMIDSTELSKSDPEGIKVKHYFHNASDEHSISNSIIMSLMEDKDGNIWAGTQAGLNKIIKTDERITFEHSYKNEDGDLLSDKKILVMHENINGKIWFSTQDGGICLLDTKSGFFHEYNSNNGFVDNIINSINQDSLGILWLGTNNGLCRFDPLNHTFRIYKTVDGLISNDFYYASNCIVNDELFFGGNKGITYFNPYEIKPTSFKPDLVFTDFKLFNKSVSLNSKGSPIKQHISVQDHLSLKFDQNYITLAFSALNYKYENELHYECILEGMESTWKNLEAERKITYMNLSPGDYRLRVKAHIPGLNDNTEEIVLPITIYPPFWKSLWAYVTYIVLLIFTAFQIYSFILNQEKKKHALALERINAKRIHELDIMKLKFYTNINHELRTPLTLISAPLESLLKENRDKKSKVFSYYQIMLNNVQRLKRLIDQLLDLRKIEEGYLKLEWANGDLIEYIKRIFQNFENYAENRDINYTFHSSATNLYSYFDADKLDKILFNLLSNAFKYTGDKGIISLNISEKSHLEMPYSGLINKYIEIKISDSGVGIPKESISKIFNPFQQVEKNKPIGSTGTGIGLTLTKALVEKHNGFISVESVVNQGSVFTIYLPIYNSNPQSETGQIQQETLSGEENTDKYMDLLEVNDKVNLKLNTKKPLLLIVEDNSDLRKFLFIELQTEYRIIEAENGQSGFEKAISNIPDLIISDVMMNIMNGLELCKKIKYDERTSHIPVILLTARYSEEIIQDSYETGADDYIKKPFNVSLLKTRINNLIEQRRKLRKLFGKGNIFDVSEIVTNKIDSQFLEKLNKVIEKNIDNTGFGPTSLASEMAMSKMQLYRKVSALTNKTVYNYIRTLRMNKAAKLLLTTDMQIAEVALSVGYTEPSNFSKCFNREFNQSPSNFIKTHKK